MKGHFHSPDLEHEFFPGHYVNEGGTWHPHELWFSDFAGGIFAIDRLMFVRLLMAAVCVIFFVVAMRNPKVAPKGLQGLAEYMLDFVRVNIAEDILGKKEGRRFLPLITAIFFAVLFGNLPSIIPGLNISPNARVGMPLVLAVVAYIAFIYAGVKKFGIRYFKNSLVVPNLNIFIQGMVVVIEFFSTFVLRPVTLTIRLMANMLAGHLILALLFGATNFFLWQFSAWTVFFPITLAGSLAFTLFELLVIGLQAYIFALLTAVYIELSLHSDEH